MESIKLFKKYNKGKHWKKHPTDYVKTFIEFLKRQQFNGIIIDLGCGDGRDVNEFNKAGFKALGIDNSEIEIKNAEVNFPYLNFKLDNIEKLNLENNSVDAFYMINVIHYVNKKVAIEEILKKLKSKGYFFVHFNLLIKDINNKVDYENKEKDILNLVSQFKIISKNIFEREDKEPIPHKHRILELILQKN